jgi:hypothetical protein
MAHGKSVTPQTFIAEKGVALIERRCLEMGFLFHPRRVDFGIDGHIDLVDPGTGRLLNSLVLVQSKASNRSFTEETSQGFRYLCEERDLELWLAGNAPVVLVLSHPDDDEAWWVEIKSSFPDATSRAARSVYVDKERDRFDKTAAGRLLNLGIPKDAGLYLRPPPKIETLTTNLMPLLDFPRSIYVGESTVSDYREAGDLLAQGRDRNSAWMLRDGMVYSFHDLRHPPLNRLCDGAIEEHDTAEWADGDDEDLQYRFKDLLQRTVQDEHPELRWHKERRHLHFKASRRLTPFKAGRGPGSRGRTVFAPHYKKTDPSQVGYYHHAALQMRFRRLGATWYCELEPDYCFTRDGREESQFADSLLSGIKRLDRHPAVAGWTRMWANHLAQDKGLLKPEISVTFGTLETVTVDLGIDDKLWGPAPAEVIADDEPEATADAAAAQAELAAAGLDGEDLLSLIQAPDDTGPSRRRRRPAPSRREPRGAR